VEQALVRRRCGRTRRAIGGAWPEEHLKGLLRHRERLQGSPIETRRALQEEFDPGIAASTISLAADEEAIRQQIEGPSNIRNAVNVARFRILVSPADFDLDRPIRVEIDGRAVFEERVVPSVPTLLHWAARDDDRKRLVAAEIELEINPLPAGQPGAMGHQRIRSSRCHSRI